MNIIEERNFKRRGVARQIHNEDVIWIGWWKLSGRISEEVGKKLAKVEVSFFEGETSKGR